MSVFVFLGSSLSPEQARRVLDCHYLPPVQQGDILKLLPRRPRAIGIVDGLFGAVPAVWHKEILAALEQGCHVFGASSMGALRAAELHPFGMRGVGEIFEAFRDGVLEDDDEVAVSHATQEYGFQELSVAMVNLRDRLRAAERETLLAHDQAESLAAYAKSLFYPERSFRALVARARDWGWPEHQRRALGEFFASPAPLLKQRDALAMLEQMRTFLAGEPAPFAAPQIVARTLFLRELAQSVAEEREPSCSFQDDASVAHTGLSLAALRKQALLQLLARAARAGLGVGATAEELGMAWQASRNAGTWRTDTDQERWLKAAGMTAAAFGQALEDLICLPKLEARLDREIDRELPRLAALLTLVRQEKRDGV